MKKNSEVQTAKPQAAPQLGITKAGSGMLRRLLVQSAQRMLGPFGRDSALRRWGFGGAGRQASQAASGGGSSAQAGGDAARHVAQRASLATVS